MYTLIDRFDCGENTELRLGKTQQGYIIGLWDCDAGEYATNPVIIKHTMPNAEAKALDYFNGKKEQSKC